MVKVRSTSSRVILAMSITIIAAGSKVNASETLCQEYDALCKNLFEVDLISVIDNLSPAISDISQAKEKINVLIKAVASPLTSDTGTYIPDFHCPSSSDSSSAPAETLNCKEWNGNAPDIGPFEGGTTKDITGSAPPPPTLHTGSEAPNQEIVSSETEQSNNPEVIYREAAQTNADDASTSEPILEVTNNNKLPSPTKEDTVITTTSTLSPADSSETASTPTPALQISALTETTVDENETTTNPTDSRPMTNNDNPQETENITSTGGNGGGSLNIVLLTLLLLTTIGGIVSKRQLG